MVSITLEAVCRELLIAQGESTENKLARYLQHGINGLREFNFDLNPDGGVPSVAYLNVNANSTVDLPPDFIDYVRIGVLDAYGNFLPLGINNNIRYDNGTDACGNPTLPNPITLEQNEDPNGLDPYFGLLWNWDGLADNFRNGELVGRFFGLGGGNNPNGYYRFNLKTGQVELGGVQASQLVLEYLADLSMNQGQYYVHPYAVSALKRFIKWESIEMNDRISDNIKQRARDEYFNEYRRAKNRFNAVRLDEYQAAFRKENKASPRF